ncbi:Spy/CpxP family protein refolding chaperone [Marinoscillum sp. MHG1-6]|uniref:Spy/CpxP family protein refolding chaperone n=1 Tax=Marinoscillum sp. MHG1-6 TaxID=2959627 RepID=UPI00215746E1|nr:periplasmic heavy metal sensor [Marinoscillum sp. MHG1-6]
MLKKVFIIGMVLIWSVGAWAQPPNGERKGPSQGGDFQKQRAEQFAERLELTEEQKVKFDEEKVRFHKESQPIMNQLREKKARLQTLVSSDEVKRKEIDQVIEEIGTLETSLLRARTNHQITSRAMLTDKQKVIFDKHSSRRMGPAPHGKGDRKG